MIFMDRVLPRNFFLGIVEVKSHLIAQKMTREGGWIKLEWETHNSKNNVAQIKMGRVRGG